MAPRKVSRENLQFKKEEFLMFPTSRRFALLPSLFALLVFASANSGSEPTALAQKAGDEKQADKPLYVEYKGVRIGMEPSEVRKKLGNPADKGDVQDFFVFSNTESAQVFYAQGKVMAVSVNYVGDRSSAPAPKAVLGTDIEAGANGAMHKLIRYPEAGYWVSYNRTGGDDPLITVTMQKIQ
jgi:hypothetical protein